MSRRILIYGDVNINYRDGSSAWLEALAECLALTGSEVHVLLKADVSDPARREVLDRIDRVTVHTPFDDKVSGFAGMKPRIAASRVAVLDRRHKFDIIISRGFDIAAALAVSGRFTGRMWAYLTEGPAFSFERTEHQTSQLTKISEQSRRIFVQTEEARSIIESLNGQIAGKTLLMNPIIPDSAFRDSITNNYPNSNFSMVYAGKFARLWKTLEMTRLPEQLAKEGIDCSLAMIGDKFQNTGSDHEWLEQMKAAAKVDDPRVHWHGGLPRGAVLDVVEQADVGLCWRDPELDASAEISTKMLECSALRTPPVLNRTRIHEQLLGEDYPLFIDNGDVVTTLRTAAGSPATVARAREIAVNAVRPYSMTATAARFSEYFARAEPDPATRGQLAIRTRRHRIVVAGHDFKFASDLIETLRQRDDVDLRFDKWHRLASHDESSSREAAQWADTVICEWAGPNAVFYSKNLPASTKLIVRFHGFEIRGRWLRDLDPNRVDAFVFVSDFYRKQVLRTLGWPEVRSTVIYNTVDTADLDRPKVPNAQFHIGMAGYVPFLKRPDRALDLMQILLREDERFYLHIRGRSPWNYQWEWGKPVGQDAYRAFFQRIANNPLLRRHVVFEPFAPDMGNWFRRIGWMVSPSSRETFHLAPIEGMASGAPALVWERDGASEIFGADQVRACSEELADLVRSARDTESWAALGTEAKSRASQYDVMQARDRWVHLLSLPRGETPPLHGISLLNEGAEPQDRAEALVALHRAFDHDGVAAAEVVLQGQPHLLEPESSMVADWKRLQGWADGSSLPPAGLAPLYNPDPRTILTVGTAMEEALPKLRSIAVEIPRSLGSFDKDVQTLADVLTRAARRERTVAIVASGSLATVLAAQIAARRAGIIWYAGAFTGVEAPGQVGVLLEKIHTRVKQDARPLAELLRTGSPRQIPRRVGETRRLKDLRIGLIADEFTRRTVSATVPCVSLHRDAAFSQLDGLDAVIVESAWEGLDNEWFHGIAYHGEEEASALWDLLIACEQQTIPVLFWNKEDPVHFRSFALPASRMNHVFTTDANRVPSYLQQPNRNATVSSLPFYAQPRLHNPLPSSRSFSQSVSFAGTYYGNRYPKRSQELNEILTVGTEFGLTIYDRQKDRPDSPYKLPTELQQYSVGAVPYDQVLEVYKSHPVNINVNSVSDSPSMFSRRVVEIAASGSVVASGAGDGIKEVLGTHFPVLTDTDDWRRHLARWFGDEEARLHDAWAQMRTVYRTHRADQSLALMLRTAAIAVNPDPLPDYGWLVNDPSEIPNAASQSLQPVIITRMDSVSTAAESHGLSVTNDITSVPWVTSASGALPTTHFEDLLIATRFLDADVLTVQVDHTPGAPLIRPGIGDTATGIWRSGIESPQDGERPWVWRVPNTRNQLR